MSRRRSIAPFCGIVAFACGVVAEPAQAQYTGRFAVSMSFSPTANEVISGTYSAGDMVVFHSTATGGGGVVWSAADLGITGLTVAPNVDAFSDGTDIIIPPSVATCTDVVIEYAVSATATGTPGGLVASEKSGNGAQSDVFSKFFLNGGGTAVYLANDHQNILPGSQIDALTWQERVMYPVFFSVDPVTAGPLSTKLGFTVTAADILKVNSAGSAPFIYRGHASLGLGPNDDIDALAVDYYQNSTIIISLKAGSPAIGSGVAPFSEGPGALFAYEPSVPGPVHFKSAADLDLAATDELTAVEVSDPCMTSIQSPAGMTPIAGIVDGNEPSPTTPTPWNFETIKVDNYIGNAPRQIWIKSASPTHTITIQTQFQNQAAIVFVGLDKICGATALYLPPAKGVLGFLPLVQLPTVAPGTGGLTIPVASGSLPPGLFIDLQGVVYDPAYAHVFTTNLVTLVTVP